MNTPLPPESNKSALPTESGSLQTIKVSFVVNVQKKDIQGLATAPLVLSIRDHIRNFIRENMNTLTYANSFRFLREGGDQTPEGWFSLDLPDNTEPQ